MLAVMMIPVIEIMVAMVVVVVARPNVLMAAL
jgi:hypothetical protein